MDRNFDYGRLKLVHGGSEYFSELLGLIRKAEYSIEILVYIINDDETGKKVTGALLEARRRGVEVTLLADAFGSRKFSGATETDLRHNGIRFRRFSPHFTHRTFTIGRLLHIKLALFDSRTALIGGINISDDYNDNIRKAWLDYAVLIDDVTVGRDLRAFCLDLFHRKLTARRLRRYDLSGRGFEVRINDWLRRHPSISASYRKMVASSEREIIILSSYFLPGYDFLAMLANAASRGVDVHLVISAQSDIPLMKAGIRYLYPWLQRNNIHLYEWKSTVLHAKLMLVDGRQCTIGSYNLNSLSEFNSLEMNVHITDEGFLRQLHSELTAMISDGSLTARIDRYETNFIISLAHWLVYRVMRILLNLMFSLMMKEKGYNGQKDLDGSP